MRVLNIFVWLNVAFSLFYLASGRGDFAAYALLLAGFFQLLLLEYKQNAIIREMKKERGRYVS